MLNRFNTLLNQFNTGQSMIKSIMAIDLGMVASRASRICRILILESPQPACFAKEWMVGKMLKSAGKMLGKL